MSTASAPQQGDHVFNDVGTAVLKPFLAIRDLHSPEASGEEFLYSHLLHTFSIAQSVGKSDRLANARQLVATGSVDDAERAFGPCRARSSASAKSINAGRLRAIHERNATQFGRAAARFDATFTVAVRNAVQVAIAGDVPQTASREDPNASMAFGRLIESAYDPAAALRLLIARLPKEPPSLAGALERLVMNVADAIDRPAFWQNPLLDLSMSDPVVAIPTVKLLKESLWDLYALNSRGMNISLLVRTEIAQAAARATPAERASYDGVLYLLHRRAQQLEI